jgi:hypothetical protein
MKKGEIVIVDGKKWKVLGTVGEVSEYNGAIFHARRGNAHHRSGKGALQDSVCRGLGNWHACGRNPSSHPKRPRLREKDNPSQQIIGRQDEGSDNRKLEIRSTASAVVAIGGTAARLPGTRLEAQPARFAVPNRACNRPRKRESVVQYALKPLLRKLAIDDSAGLHAFRHGLATELAEASVPIPVLQTQMRHADVKTTLRVCVQIIPQSQRDAIERASLPIGTNVQLEHERKAN